MVSQEIGRPGGRILVFSKTKAFENLSNRLAGVRPSRSNLRTLRNESFWCWKFFEHFGKTTVGEIDQWVEEARRDPSIAVEGFNQYIKEMDRKNVADRSLEAVRTSLLSFARANEISLNEDRVLRPRSRRPVRETLPLTKETVKTLVEAADLRERALILLASTSGLRISEVASLTYDDVKEVFERNEEPYAIVVRNEVAKGGRGYISFCNEEAASAIRAYVKRRNPKGPWRGRLFTRLNGLYWSWSRALKNAGLDPTKYRFHDLRRYCRTTLAMAGVPESIIEKLIGHGGNSLVNIYTKPDVETLRNFYKKALPYFNLYRADREQLRKELLDEIKADIKRGEIKDLETKIARLEGMLESLPYLMKKKKAKETRNRGEQEG